MQSLQAREKREKVESSVKCVTNSGNFQMYAA